MTDFETLLEVLTEHEVEFILVGGVAATVHGSARLTQDLDVVYRRSPENITRLTAALRDQEPYLRGAPPDLPFDWSARALERGLNFTLSTKLGDLDLLGELTGGGSYENLVDGSERIEIFGMECLCLNLDRLIQVKRAAGRPRDLDAIAELEAIREERANCEGEG